MKLQSALIGLSLLASTATSFAEAVTLKMKYAPGDKYELSYQMDTLMGINMGGQVQNMEMNMEMNMDQEVVEHEKGAAVKLGYDSLKMKMDGMGQKINYDSTKENNDPVAKQMGESLKPLLDSKFKMIVDKDGQILEVEDVEVNPQLAQMGISPNDMLENLKQQQKMLPEMPVKVGDKWEQVIEMPLGGGEELVEVQTKMELVSIDDKKAKIRFTGELDGTMDQAGMEMKFKSEKYEGVSTFDIDLGQFTDSKVDMKLKLTMGEIGFMDMDANINLKLTEVE